MLFFSCVDMSLFVFGFSERCDVGTQTDVPEPTSLKLRLPRNGWTKQQSRKRWERRRRMRERLLALRPYGMWRSLCVGCGEQFCHCVGMPRVFLDPCRSTDVGYDGELTDAETEIVEEV